MANNPFGNDIGQLILQAAQGIIAQNQQNQQMQLQLEKFKEEVGTQERVFKLRDQELELRERAITVQEEQQKLAQANAPLALQAKQLDIQKTEADIRYTEARTKAVTSGKGEGGGGLTANAEMSANAKVWEEARGREVQNMISSYRERTGAGIPLVDSFDMLDKLKAQLGTDIQKFNTSDASLVGNVPPEIAAKQNQLREIAEMEADKSFQFQRQRLSDQGPDPVVKAEVAQQLFPGIADQLDYSPGAKLPTFDFGPVPVGRVQRAWNMVDSGNVEIMADLMLGSRPQITPDDYKAIQRDFMARYGTTGEDAQMATKRFRELVNLLKARSQ